MMYCPQHHNSLIHLKTDYVQVYKFFLQGPTIVGLLSVCAVYLAIFSLRNHFHPAKSFCSFLFRTRFV